MISGGGGGAIAVGGAIQVSTREAIIAASQAYVMTLANGLARQVNMSKTGSEAPASKMAAAEANATGPNTGMIPGHPTFKPGPYVGGSIPAASSAQTFTAAQRAAVDAIGIKTGCHTCGVKTPGTKTGHFVPDHQPPTRLNDANLAQELFPQCIDCSREQGSACQKIEE